VRGEFLADGAIAFLVLGVSADAYTAALAGRGKGYVLHFAVICTYYLDAQRENSWFLLHTQNSMPFPRALTRAYLDDALLHGKEGGSCLLDSYA
jgi:hypothetical protein